MVAFKNVLWPLLAGMACATAVYSAPKMSDMPGVPDKSDGLVAFNMSTLSLEKLEVELQQCQIVQDLNRHLVSTAPPPSSLSSLFHILFPSSKPAVNALLATLYISGPPNILLALCPANVDPASLQLMVSFAVGGLMGDVLFHLLPEIFLGEADVGSGARLVLVEPNRNLLLGLTILVGFMTFVAMDKGMRIASGVAGGHDHSHSHSHSHAEPNNSDKEGVLTSSVQVGGGSELKKRRGGGGGGGGSSNDGVVTGGKDGDKEVSPSMKMGGYLNLIADFTHNITDGLAMSASFYASPTVGATTTVAVFFHEIPHEVGDFALLIQSGFTKWQAMGAQFATAVGALLGTVMGILVQEMGGSSADDSEDGMPISAGLAGTSLVWGDLLLPFTAGTFLYVATVAVVPELLETGGGSSAGEARKGLMQLAAVTAGAGIMLYISWH